MNLLFEEISISNILGKLKYSLAFDVARWCIAWDGWEEGCPLGWPLGCPVGRPVGLLSRRD